MKKTLFLALIATAVATTVTLESASTIMAPGSKYQLEQLKAVRDDIRRLGGELEVAVRVINDENTSEDDRRYYLNQRENIIAQLREAETQLKAIARDRLSIQY